MSRQSSHLTSLPNLALLRDPNSQEELRRTIDAWSAFIQRYHISDDESLRQMVMMTLLRRGAAYGHLQEYEAALADVECVLSSQPNTYATCKAYELRASILSTLQKDLEALEAWAQALPLCHQVPLEPEELAELYLERGKCYARLERHEEAVADFAQAIQIDAHCAEAYCWQGLSYVYLDHGAQALASCTRAIELMPHHAPFLRIRSAVYRILNQFECALADLDKAATFTPDDPAIQREKRHVQMKWLLVGDPFAATGAWKAPNEPPVATQPSKQKRAQKPTAGKQMDRREQYSFF